MCNLYSITKGQQAILESTRAMVDRTGMTMPWKEAAALQRPLRDGSLKIVARGIKEDGANDAAI